MIDRLLPLIASESLSPTYQWGRLESLTAPWQIVLLCLVAALIVGWTISVYRRDSVDLQPGVAWFLAQARIAALVGLSLLFLQLEKRVGRIHTDGSRVLILVDTSQSMKNPTEQSSETDAEISRIEQVVRTLVDPDFINVIRQTHRVDIFHFDRQLDIKPVDSLPQLASEDTSDKSVTDESTSGPTTGEEDATPAAIPNWILSIAPALDDWALDAVPISLWWTLASVTAGSCLLGLFWMVFFRRSARTDFLQWMFALAGCFLPAVPIVAMIIHVAAHHDEVDLSSTTSNQPSTAEDESSIANFDQKSLRAELVASGEETRLTEAIKQLIDRQKSHPIAGILVFTDGGQTSAADFKSQIDADAQQLRFPIFTIGLGSKGESVAKKNPPRLQVSRFHVPRSVYKDDRFTVSTELEFAELTGETATLTLYELVPLHPSDMSSGAKKTRRSIAEKQITLKHQQTNSSLVDDAQQLSFSFAIPPMKPGLHEFEIEVRLNNSALAESDESHDNSRRGTTKIVKNRRRVLLFSGGPSREYRYLRDMLYKDPTVEVHVLLQTIWEQTDSTDEAEILAGISQNADKVLTRFPETKKQLDQYIAIVAIDPDWTELDPRWRSMIDRDGRLPLAELEKRVSLLEQWVGNRSGGLIVVAGPVNTPKWVGDRRYLAALQKIRTLYPVQFRRQTSRLDREKFRSEDPWSIVLTDSGRSMPFLRFVDPRESITVNDALKKSLTIWTDFAGAYGYYPVLNVKPGATVYANYTIPDAGNNRPVYFVGHYYGSGRVFYMGSGEMWRIRGLNPKYFDTFYTKLIHFVSEGRLLQSSEYGSLLFSDPAKRFPSGKRVEIRANLRDARQNPLDALQAPLRITGPEGSPVILPLLADPTRKGMYHGSFIPGKDGRHVLELDVPGVDAPPIKEEIYVVAAKKEETHSNRNDILLESIAEDSGGHYYIGTNGLTGENPIASKLEDRKRSKRIDGLSGPSGERWEERWNMILMLVACGMLFIEWTGRRLLRLA